MWLGGRGNDTLTGDIGRNTLRGNSGDDRLSGGEGAELLYGGEGRDMCALLRCRDGRTVSRSGRPQSAGFLLPCDCTARDATCCW